jgi:peptide/nickel transport system permease protein
VRSLTYFLVQRSLLAGLVVLVVSLTTFVAMDLATDPQEAIAGEWMLPTPELYETSLWLRYLAWLTNVLQGDLGESYIWSCPVIDVIVAHLGVTAMLASSAFVSAILLSLILVYIVQRKSGSWWSRMIIIICVFLHATPAFSLSLLLMWIFAVNLAWLPVSGLADGYGYVLPALTLTLSITPRLVLVLDQQVNHLLESDFILQQRCCGMHGWSLWQRHLLINLIPALLGVATIQVVHLFTGAVVTESVFSVNGLGRLTIDSVISGDLNMIVALSLLFSLVAVGVDILVQLVMYLWFPSLEPRG